MYKVCYLTLIPIYATRFSSHHAQLFAADAIFVCNDASVNCNTLSTTSTYLSIRHSGFTHTLHLSICIILLLVKFSTSSSAPFIGIPHLHITTRDISFASVHQ